MEKSLANQLFKSRTNSRILIVLAVHQGFFNGFSLKKNLRMVLHKDVLKEVRVAFYCEATLDRFMYLKEEVFQNAEQEIKELSGVDTRTVSFVFDAICRVGFIEIKFIAKTLDEKKIAINEFISITKSFCGTKISKLTNAILDCLIKA